MNLDILKELSKTPLCSGDEVVLLALKEKDNDCWFAALPLMATYNGKGAINAIEYDSVDIIFWSKVFEIFAKAHAVEHTITKKINNGIANQGNKKGNSSEYTYLLISKEIYDNFSLETYSDDCNLNDIKKDINNLRQEKMAITQIAHTPSICPVAEKLCEEHLKNGFIYFYGKYMKFFGINALNTILCIENGIPMIKQNWDRILSSTYEKILYDEITNIERTGAENELVKRLLQATRFQEKVMKKGND